ncbi:transcription initiation factor TFIID subunit 4-like isoform X2 [Astatotilapia calliptera]|uniref:transcription initiation factor TFIID subunit 4-like isoform X2 n=1 Tax=Astatotilapia calliptera TaxID=8154 RepID=UPI000E413DB2|nr:transcription initiation factor TFIID subunit 4-like isoform X2 [Astatotilapia calliptera]
MQHRTARERHTVLEATTAAVMATKNVVTEANRLEPQAAPGDGDASVQVRIQVAVTAASMSQSDSVSAPPKVVPSGQPSTCAVSGPRTSPPVVVVANAGVSAGNQQTTKQPQNQVASVKQVTTTGRTVLITVPRSATAQPVTPRLPQATSPHLPANIQIPPGMMLIRSDSGQLMLVSQQALVQAQQGQRLISGQPTRILAPQVCAAAESKRNENVTVIKMTPTSSFQQAAPVQKTAVVIGVAPKPALVHTVNVVSERGSHAGTQAAGAKKESAPTFSKETLESVKKCKNFLVTLIKLASSDSRSVNVANNVQALVRSLLEGKLEAEAFTEQLYDTLKSTPQPCLVPFLKKSLPAVRCLTADPQLFIQKASASTPPPSTPSSSIKQSNTEIGKTLQNRQQVFQPRGVALRPGLTTLVQSRNCISKKPTTRPIVGYSGKNFSGGFSVKQPFPREPPNSTKFAFRDSSGSYKEDDDINDVTSMAGVNLREENAQILTSTVGAVVQSCQDQLFLSTHPVLSRILHTGQALGVTDVGPDVVALVSHATQEFLHGLLEKLTVMAEHRKTALKNSWHTQVSDVRSQLRFLEEIETLQKKKRDEEERERLLRFARSRSHTEDPEYQQLKQKAKELQQIEEAQLQQREANLAALAAIGPRRKRPLDQADSQVCVLPRPGVHRVTRLILKDLLVCMEEEPFLRHSLTLYKAML